MTLFIALMLLHLTGHLSLFTILGTVLLWHIHLAFHARNY